MINHDLPFRYRSDKLGRLYRPLKPGETVSDGDTAIFHDEVEEVTADANIIINDPYFSTSIGTKVTDAPGLFYLRAMETEQLYRVKDRPGVKYRMLKLGEVTREGDTAWTKTFPPRDGVIPGLIGAHVGGTVKEDDYNYYFRPVEEPTPRPVEEPAPRPDVTHILVPVGAASSLLELWFSKYSTTCDDGAEAAVLPPTEDANISLRMGACAPLDAA
jgi:hypothetical protein